MTRVGSQRHSKKKKIKIKIKINYTVKNTLTFLVIILVLKKEGHAFFRIVGNRYSGGVMPI